MLKGINVFGFYTHYCIIFNATINLEYEQKY